MEQPNSDKTKEEQEPREQQEQVEDQPEQEKNEDRGETEIDVSKIIENTETTETGEAEEKEEEEEEGFGTAINNAFGRILTIDLEPDKDKTKNLRKQLKGLAEDVRLGKNANRFLQEYVFTDEEPDPKTALLGSTISALALAVAIRPDLITKIKNKVKGEPA